MNVEKTFLGDASERNNTVSPPSPNKEFESKGDDTDKFIKVLNYIMECIEKNQKLFTKLVPPNKCLVVEPLTKVNIVTLSHMREDMKSYQPTGKANNYPDMPFAISIAAKALIFPKDVKMLHLVDFFKQDLPIWSGSPGLPWTQMGYKTKGSIRDDIVAINRVRLFWHQIKPGKPMPKDECFEFVPTQLIQEGEDKAQAVWSYPATMVFGEAVFALPLLREYIKGNYPIAYGREMGQDGSMTSIQNIKGNFFLGITFKCFNKNIPDWLIRKAFDILFCNINFIYYEDYGVADARAVIRMWDYIVDYFINTPIRMCNGERCIKSGGIASGSYFTQLIGSIVNYILMTYVSLVLRNTMQSILVLGEDSLCGFEKPIDPHDVGLVLEPLGMGVNVEKSSATNTSQIRLS